MGEINIDFYNANCFGYADMQALCVTFNLKNLIKLKDKTCFAVPQGSTLDVILTNKPQSFINTATYESGLSDHHAMITTFLRSHVIRSKPKKIFYRNYKNFNANSFLSDVENAKFCCNTGDPDLNHENLVGTFKSIIDKNAPLKQKVLRGNEAPFMNKELKKAIYTRSRLKNNLNKSRTEENNTKYKKQRNKCVTLRKKP